MNAKDVLTNHQNFAVTGVTNSQEKYGYKIYQCLKNIGKTVYAISPLYKNIEEIPTYPNLSAINNKIDTAVFVVNPKLRLIMLKNAKS